MYTYHAREQPEAVQHWWKWLTRRCLLQHHFAVRWEGATGCWQPLFDMGSRSTLQWRSFARRNESPHWLRLALRRLRLGAGSRALVIIRRLVYLQWQSGDWMYGSRMDCSLVVTINRPESRSPTTGT